MPKFTLAAEVTVTAWTKVEADTLEDAIELASDRDVVIGGPGSGAEETETWIIDEADGSPLNIHVI